MEIALCLRNTILGLLLTDTNILLYSALRTILGMTTRVNEPMTNELDNPFGCHFNNLYQVE